MCPIFSSDGVGSMSSESYHIDAPKEASVINSSDGVGSIVIISTVVQRNTVSRNGDVYPSDDIEEEEGEEFIIPSLSGSDIVRDENNPVNLAEAIVKNQSIKVNIPPQNNKSFKKHRH